MTKQLRWSESKSEVDPVVRAVVRYAQGVRPTRHQEDLFVARIAAVAGVSGATAASSIWVKLVPSKFAWFLSGGAVVGAASLLVGHLAASPSAPTQSHAAPLATLLRPTWTTRSSQALRQESPTTDLASVQRHPNGPAKGRHAAEPAVPKDEVELLQLGRRVLSTQPAKTLALVEQHAQLFPRSALQQERDALEIEALFSLGAGTAGQQKLLAFAQKYPSSLYYRRLERLNSGNR